MDILTEFMRWRESLRELPPREPDSVHTETLPSGAIITCYFRNAETVPYLTMTQMPTGDNWMPRLTDKQIAAIRRDVDKDLQAGRVIDL